MKIIRLLAVSASALALTACIKAPIEGGGKSANVNKLQISFTIPDQVPGTYASVGTLPSEREFDEAFVIFYNTSGEYVAHVSSNTHSNSSTGNFEVIKPAAVELDKQYKILVVANLKHYLDPSYSSTGDYIDANKMLKIDAMRAEIRAVSNNRVSRKLPMYAQGDAILSSSPGIISVVFERAVARFDFVSLETSLDVEWVKVCNYNNAGYLYHNDYNATGSVIINGAGSSDVEENPKKVNLTRRSEMTDQMAAQSNENGGLYAFPNINVNTGINDKKTTCLLFKGTYSYVDKDGNPQTKEGYYRVNVCMSGKPQNLKRNNLYRITVKLVSDGGADSEDEAMNNPALNVNYEINDWTVDNSQGIVTDTNGNYLVVSPTSAYIGGSTGSSLTGGVQVNAGMSWAVEKLNPADNWFSVAKTADGNGFGLTALTDNATSGVRMSKIRIRVLGTTLQYDVFVYQYTQNGSEDVLLIVDGRMGDFSLDVNGNGQTYKLQTILGANSANATMTFVSGDGSMIQTANPAIGTPGIGNNSTISLVFRANAAGADRSAIYQITRQDGINPDISLKITFIQPEATQIIVPTPNTIFNEGVVDGFMNLPGAADCNRCQAERVYVTSRNMLVCPKWKATSTFNTYDVTLVAKSADPSLPVIYPSHNAVVTGSGGDYFDIAVARCGPGDEPLMGTITIQGCDADGNVVSSGPMYTIPLTVQSSLQSGFTQIGSTLYHDRNIGTPEYNIADESKITVQALPFSNTSTDYQCADKINYDNHLFRGTYHTYAQANSPANALCPPGWRMPTKTEFATLASQMQWAKAGGRPYVVANNGAEKNIKGCYFTLSGIGTEQYSTIGHCWTGTSSDPGYGYFMALNTTRAVVSATGTSNSNTFVVRCVRNI